MMLDIGARSDHPWIKGGGIWGGGPVKFILNIIRMMLLKIQISSAMLIQMLEEKFKLSMKINFPSTYPYQRTLISK
jgi:hypothetical protein